MKGKIAFEEHTAIEETLQETRSFAGESGNWEERSPLGSPSGRSSLLG